MRDAGSWFSETYLRYGGENQRDPQQSRLDYFLVSNLDCAEFAEHRLILRDSTARERIGKIEC